MRRLISGALSVLMALGLMLSLSSAASANALAGGGYSSSYAGESIFTNNAAGETGQMSAIFFNDGQVAWSPGVVGLLICAADQVTCNVAGANAAYAKSWYSTTVYATVTSTVAPGQNGFFIYNFTVPAGTPAGTAATFNGDVGLIAAGTELRPQGYFQVNTTPTLAATLTLTPTTASVAVGATQQFTASGIPTGATVAWSVNGGCGAVTSDGVFVGTAMNAVTQPCSVQASAGGATGKATVTVFGPASQLGCYASPAGVVANGGIGNGKATGYFQIKDVNGNVVANASAPTITIVNVTPNLDTATPTGSVTPVNGVATVAIASTTTAGTIQLSASAPNLTGCALQIPSTATGSSAATTTTFVTNPIAADAISTSTMRIDVVDANGNRNVTDNSTTLQITRDSGAGVCNMIGITHGTGSIGPASSSATVAQGRADITVQSTSTPGTCTFSATTNNASIAGSSGSLTTQIVGVANRLTVSSNDSPHQASSTGTCTWAGAPNGTNTNTMLSCTIIVVAVRDANGALVTGDSGRSITVTFDSGSCTGATPGPVSVNDSQTTSGGVATIAIKSPGAYPGCQITFSASGLIGVSTTAVWTGGGADHLACTFAPNPIVADGASVSTGTVTVRDTANNIVPGTYSVNFFRTAGGGSTTFISTNPQTTNSGYAYFNVQSTHSVGTDTYTPSIASGATLAGVNQSCTIQVQ